MRPLNFSEACVTGPVPVKNTVERLSLWGEGQSRRCLPQLRTAPDHDGWRKKAGS